MNVFNIAESRAPVFRKRVRAWLSFAACCWAFSNTLGTTDEVVWSNVPIPLRLQVDNEHMLVFDQAVEVGLPQSLRSQLLIENIGNSLYLNAQSEFSETRLLVRDLAHRTVFVFDLSASQEPKLAERTYVRNGRLGTASSVTSEPSYAELTRFAALQIHAPRRLVPGSRQMRETRVGISGERLLRGLNVQISPLKSWRTPEKTYVTAVRVRNLADQAVELDPRQLRGRWLAATFQHYRLLQYGGDADETHVYLISKSPFSTALGEQP